MKKLLTILLSMCLIIGLSVNAYAYDDDSYASGYSNDEYEAYYGTSYGLNFKCHAFNKYGIHPYVDVSGYGRAAWSSYKYWYPDSITLDVTYNCIGAHNQAVLTATGALIQGASGANFSISVNYGYDYVRWTYSYFGRDEWELRMNLDESIEGMSRVDAQWGTSHAVFTKGSKYYSITAR